MSWSGELLEVAYVVRAASWPGEVVAEQPLIVTPAVASAAGPTVRWVDDERSRYLRSLPGVGLVVALLTAFFAVLTFVTERETAVMFGLGLILTPSYAAWRLWDGLRARRLATLVGVDWELRRGTPGATVELRYRARGEVRRADWEVVLIERAGHEVVVRGARRSRKELRYDGRTNTLGGGPLSLPEGSVQLAVPPDWPCSLRVGPHEVRWALRVSLAHRDGVRVVDVPLTVLGA